MINANVSVCVVVVVVCWFYLERHIDKELSSSSPSMRLCIHLCFRIFSRP